MKNSGFLLVFLAILTVALCGCSNLPDGFVKDSRPGRTSADIQQRTARSIDMDRQDFFDDVDHFWFFDKPSRLNELRIR
jgi:hypothetical protein